MAVVTYGALITDLRGSIGGTTFQNNASGAIARSRSYTPVNPSRQQSDRQLAMIQLVAYWAKLSAANKALWNALAVAHRKINDWGNYARLSGYQWFMSYNLNAFTLDQGPWDYPQSYILVDPPAAFNLVADHDHLYLDFGTPVAFPGTYAGIYATVPMRQSAIKMRKSTFLLSVWATTNTQYIYIEDEYAALFNVIWSDFYDNSECSIIVRMKNFAEDTGFASPFTSNIIQIPYIPNIGDSYAGGKLAYILAPGDPGYVVGEFHGIIAASSDQSAGIYWHAIPDGDTEAYGTAIGTGAANTAAIITLYGAEANAAKLCSDLVLNGYSDWVLPSRDDLLKLYLNRVAIGGFTADYYWSSTESSAGQALWVYFANGTYGTEDKDITMRVRAIRYF